MKRRSCFFKYLESFLFLFCFLLFNDTEALAVQIHGPPEGFFVHIMGHIFFAASLIFILYLLEHHPQKHQNGWRWLRYSFWFFLAWNLDTLMVHIVYRRMSYSSLYLPLNMWEHKLLPPYNIEHILYYIGRFDHLLCIPAMLFFVLSLRSFLQSHSEDDTL